MVASLTCNAGKKLSSSNQDVLRDLPEDGYVDPIVCHISHNLLYVCRIAATKM